MKKLYNEDIGSLSVQIMEWAESKGLNLTEKEWDELCNLIDEELEPFSHGYQNYN